MSARFNHFTRVHDLGAIMASRVLYAALRARGVDVKDSAWSRFNVRARLERVAQSAPCPIPEPKEQP